MNIVDLQCCVSFRCAAKWFDYTLHTMLCLVTQSCPTLQPHQVPLSMGILQARILEWVAIPSSRGSSPPRDRTQVSCIAGGFFTIWVIREPQEYWSGSPVPSPVGLPGPGIELGSPALQADCLPTELPGKPLYIHTQILLPYRSLQNIEYSSMSLSRLWEASSRKEQISML